MNEQNIFRPKWAVGQKVYIFKTQGNFAAGEKRMTMKVIIQKTTVTGIRSTDVKQDMYGDFDTSQGVPLGTPVNRIVRSCNWNYRTANDTGELSEDKIFETYERAYETLEKYIRNNNDITVVFRRCDDEAGMPFLAFDEQ